MSNSAIIVENLSKQYRLGIYGHGMLSHDLQSWWARFRGKEDPNTKVNSQSEEARPNPNEKFWALKNISFDVKTGEILGIIGRNGAGKSTLLKILSRVTTPTDGLVKIKGRVASLLEVGTGFHPELTGRENVYLNGSILGMTRIEIDKKFDEIVAFAEIERFIDTPVKRYSSGMFVRLAFAVAAHLDPDILLVDEVLAVGDAAFQKKCLGSMEDISKRQGKTVFFVSHNMAVISSICSRVIYIQSGSVYADGKADDVIELYQQSLGSKQTAFVDLKNWPNRYGSGELGRFTSVALCNLSGEPRDTIPMGQGLKIRLSIHFDRPVKAPEIGVAISNLLGQRVTHLVSAWEGLNKSVAEGDFEYEVTISQLLLVPGFYSLALWLRKEGSRVAGAADDFVEGALKFEVTPSVIKGRVPYFDAYCKAGEFYVESDWHVERI